MKPVKHILIPTDFSAGAELAYPAALRIAMKFGAKIDLIHVIPSLKHFMRFLSADMDSEFTDTMLAAAEQNIENVIMGFNETVRGRYYLNIDKKPSEAILSHINDHPYDLIIMGTKGAEKSTVRRGGTTQQVMRNAKVPVLTLDSDITPQEIRQILLPTDSSELSLSALPHAVTMAHTFGSEIILYYMVEMYGGMTETTQFTPERLDKEKIYSELMDRVDAYMKSRKLSGLKLNRGNELFKDELSVTIGGKTTAIPLTTVIEAGYSAYFEIERYASENSDLVVMATHGHTGFAHLLMGSVTEKVVQYLKKPVLTIRPHDAEFDQSSENKRGLIFWNPLP